MSVASFFILTVIGLIVLAWYLTHYLEDVGRMSGLLDDKQNHSLLDDDINEKHLIVNLRKKSINILLLSLLSTNSVQNK